MHCLDVQDYRKPFPFELLHDQDHVGEMAGLFFPDRVLIDESDELKGIFIGQPRTQREVLVEYCLPIYCGQQNAVDIAQGNSANLTGLDQTYEQTPASFDFGAVVVHAGVRRETVERKATRSYLDELAPIL